MQPGTEPSKLHKSVRLFEPVARVLPKVHKVRPKKGKAELEKEARDATEERRKGDEPTVDPDSVDLMPHGAKPGAWSEVQEPWARLHRNSHEAPYGFLLVPVGGRGADVDTQ